MKAPQLFIQFAQLFMICTGLAEESMTAEEMRKRVISGKIPEAEKEAILERLLHLERTGSSKKALGFKCDLLDGMDFDMVSGPLGIYAHTMFMHGLIEFFKEREDADLPLPIVDIRVVKSRLRDLFKEDILSSIETAEPVRTQESKQQALDNLIANLRQRRRNISYLDPRDFYLIIQTAKKFRRDNRVRGLHLACWQSLDMHISQEDITANDYNTMRRLLSDLREFIEDDSFTV